MVFDPNDKQHANPPQQSDAAARAELEQALEPPPAYHSKSSVVNQKVPLNADGLAQQLEWVGFDPAEARKVVR
jgi:hypothetical protein